MSLIDSYKERVREGKMVNLTIDLTNPENIETAEKVFDELISTSDIMKEIKCD